MDLFHILQLANHASYRAEGHMSSKGDELRTSQHWRERAEEARARAAEMRDKEAEIIMRGIAAMYDDMADRVAKREGAEK